MKQSVLLHILLILQLGFAFKSSWTSPNDVTKRDGNPPTANPLYGKKLLLPLLGSYKIELMPVKLNNSVVNLYPNKKVKQLYQLYYRSNVRKKLNFGQYLIESQNINLVNVATDTTIYLPQNFLARHKKIRVKKGQIIRNGKQIKNGHYIFVIDKYDQFLVAKKRRETPFGRIQHSSLSRGEPVYAAGKFYVNQNPGQKKKSYMLSNQSGHYKPSDRNLQRALNWFLQRFDSFKVIKDQTFNKSNIMKKRVIVFE